MNYQAKMGMDVESELRASNAQVQLVNYRFGEPPESVMRLDDTIRVELCLSGRHRSARACFSDRWSPQRFERIGELFVVPPTIDMIARSDEDRPLHSVVCHLALGQTLALFEEGPVPELTDHFLLVGLDVRDANLRRLLLRLADETRRPGFGSRVLVEAMAAQISVDLLRYGGAIPQPQAASGGLNAWQLRRIDERLQDVREAPSLAELAELCHVSVRQLTRGYRVARGGSVGAQVASSQMMHARALLAAGEPVGLIAERLGFASSSNFCQAFRRAAGVSPGQYRRMGSSN